jgi:hypothetical protein
MKTGRVFFLLVLLIALFTGATNNRAIISDNALETDSSFTDLYSYIQGNGISFEAFEYALIGYFKLDKQQMLNNDTLLTIIDYSRPSNVERLFVIDLKNCRVHLKSLVAHGQATGDLFAESFSNNPHSHQSSLGFFITDEVYAGKHGYSLKLRGIEKNINDNAEKRSIVFHGANYVSYMYLNEFGRLGRSFGCLALPPEKNREIIDLIKNKSCVFIYYPANDYLNKSKLIVKGNFSQINFE